MFAQVSEILKGAFSSNSTLAVDAVNASFSGMVTDGSAFRDVDPFNCTSAGGYTALDLGSVETDFKALQYAMSITIVVELLGALFFFATAW